LHTIGCALAADVAIIVFKHNVKLLCRASFCLVTPPQRGLVDKVCVVGKADKSSTRVLPCIPRVSCDLPTRRGPAASDVAICTIIGARERAGSFGPSASSLSSALAGEGERDRSIWRTHVAAWFTRSGCFDSLHRRR
jgi:hypothetical protein